MPYFKREAATVDERIEPTPKWYRVTRKHVLYALATLVAISTATIFLLPFAIREGIEYALRSQGHESAHVEEVYFNPFTATLMVRGLTGGEQNDAVLDAGHVHMVLDMAAMFQGNILIKTILLEDIAIHVRLDDAGQWHVGKIAIAPSQPDAPTNEPSSLPFGLGAESVTFRDIRLQFDQQHIRADVIIQEGTISELRTWTAEHPAPFEMALTINDSAASLSGHTTPFHETVTMDINVVLERFPLESVASLAAQLGVSELNGVVRGDVDALLELQLVEQSVNASVSGQFSLANIAAIYDTYRAQSDFIGWDGDVSAVGELSTPIIRADGSLSAANLQFADNSQEISAEGAVVSWTGTADLDLAEPAGLALSGEMKGKNISARGPSTAFEEATIESMDASVERLEIAVDDEIHLTVALLRGGLSGWRAKGLAGLPGSLTLASGEVEGAELIGILNAQSFSAKGAVIGRIQNLVASDVAPELPEAAIANGNVVLTGLRLESDMSGLQLNAKAEFSASTISASLASPAASGHVDDFKGTMTLATVATENDPLEFHIEGLINSSNLRAVNTESGLEVARLDHLSISGIEVEKIEDMRVASVALQRPRLLQRPGRNKEADDEYVATMGAVTVNEISVTNLRAVVDEVIVDGLSGHVLVSENRDIEPLALLSTLLPEETTISEGEVKNEASAIPNTATPPPVAASPVHSPNFSIRVNLIELKGDTVIRLEDQSVDPAVNMEARELIAKMQNLDSDTPDLLAPVSFEATLGSISRLRIAGDVAPLSAQPSGNVQAQIQTIDLLDLTGYSQRNIGYKIDSGEFSVNSDIRIDKGQLQTQNNLFLNQLVLSKLDQEELTELDNQLGMPVNTAVNLLRDGNGNIELSIPVEGDMNNPDIKIGQVIRKAMGGAMKKSVLTVFAPLRLLGKGKDEEPLTEALRFKEVPFESASTIYDPEATDYLEEITKIMRKHPGVSLRLRGVASFHDRDEMVSKAMTESIEAMSLTSASKPTPALIPAGEAEIYVSPPASEVAVAQPTPEIPDEVLIQLADERAQEIKSYLVDTGGVEPTRLFISESIIDVEGDSTLSPRVEIGL